MTNIGADVLDRANRAITRLRAELERERAKTSEPIAVVGASCLFPAGGTGMAAYWRAVALGRDGTSEAPKGRLGLDELYDPAGGSSKTNIKRASFLEDVKGF